MLRTEPIRQPIPVPELWYYFASRVSAAPSTADSMIIRSEQLAKIDEALQKQYHETLRRLLRDRFPQLVDRFDDHTLLDRIGKAVPQARSYGITSGEGILAYLGMSLAAGPAFHADPQICAFLSLKGRDPDSRVRWMFERVLTNLQSIAGQLTGAQNSPSGKG